MVAKRISPSRLFILCALSDGESTLGSLASKCGIGPAAITSLVIGLAARGLIIRYHPDGEKVDRRKVYARLTDKGREFLAEMTSLSQP